MHHDAGTLIEAHGGLQGLVAGGPGDPGDLAQLHAPAGVEPLGHVGDQRAALAEPARQALGEADGHGAGQNDEPLGRRKPGRVLDEAVEGAHAELEPGPEVGKAEDQDVAGPEVGEVVGRLARRSGRRRLLTNGVDTTPVHVIADGFVTGPLPEGHLLRSDRAESDDADSGVWFQRTCIRYQEALWAPDKGKPEGSGALRL